MWPHQNDFKFPNCVYLLRQTVLGLSVHQQPQNLWFLFVLFCFSLNFSRQSASVLPSVCLYVTADKKTIAWVAKQARIITPLAESRTALLSVTATINHKPERFRGAERLMCCGKWLFFGHKCIHPPLIWGCLRKWVLEREVSWDIRLAVTHSFFLLSSPQRPSSMWSCCTQHS